MNVLLEQPVMVTVFDEALRGVNRRQRDLAAKPVCSRLVWESPTALLHHSAYSAAVVALRILNDDYKSVMLHLIPAPQTVSRHQTPALPPERPLPVAVFPGYVEPGSSPAACDGGQHS